ncbi:MAG: nickel/cobalt transporter [Sediminispirochaetaceae bacterium]
MKKRRIVWILLLAAAAAPITAQENPFLSSGSDDGGQGSNVISPDMEENPAADTAVRPRRSTRQGPLARRIAGMQREIYESLASVMQKVKAAEGSPQVFFLVIAGAFLYGIIHALGPGHRKTVLFSYFMAEEVPLIWGVGAGVMMGMLHGAAAVLIILPLYYLLKGSLLLTFNEVSRSIELGTFAFIALFGAVMLIISILRLVKEGREEGTEARHRSCSRGRTLLIIIGSSLVPCPGAAMILLFALSLQMTGVGLLAVLSMSAGMSLTLSMVALITLRARTSLQRMGGGGSRSSEYLHHGLELGGYLLITGFGLIMTAGML